MAAGRTYYGLDGLRGFAALAVLAFHASQVVHAPWLMPSGFLAVDLFFVISGFVIAHAYDLRMAGLGPAGFLISRAARLYPLFLLGVALGLVRVGEQVLAGRDVSGWALSLLCNLSFLPAPPSAFSKVVLFPLDGPGWSLMLEVWVNVAFALLFPRLSQRVLLGVAITTGAALVVCAVFWPRLLDGGSEWPTVGMGPIRVLYSFSIGVLLRRNEGRLPNLSRLSPLVGPIVLILMHAPRDGLGALGFILLVSPALVIAASQTKRRSPVAAWGASTSYPLYVLHFPLLGLVWDLVVRQGRDPLAPTLTMIALLLLACPWIGQFYDQPIRNALRDRLRLGAFVGGERIGAIRSVQEADVTAG